MPEVSDYGIWQDVCPAATALKEMGIHMDDVVKVAFRLEADDVKVVKHEEAAPVLPDIPAIPLPEDTQASVKH